jgi:hypothetical protein
MSEIVPKPQARASSRIVPYVVVVVLIGLVIAAAAYQEEISFFFRLHGWDKAAPGRSVAGFLDAGRKGDEQTADSYLGVDVFKPLKQNGKWVGYTMTTNAGTMQYVMADLAPAGEPRPTKTEFVYIGDGAAMVTMPDHAGKGIDYRLQMKDGGWKITEIRGGRGRK